MANILTNSAFVGFGFPFSTVTAKNGDRLNVTAFVELISGDREAIWEDLDKLIFLCSIHIAIPKMVSSNKAEDLLLTI